MCISKIHDQQQTHVHPTLETPRRDGKDLVPSHNSYELCAGCVATRQKSTVLLTWVLLQEHPTSWFQFPQWGTGTSGFATDGHNSVEATAHTVQQEALGHDGLLVILCKGWLHHRNFPRPTNLKKNWMFRSPCRCPSLPSHTSSRLLHLAAAGKVPAARAEGGPPWQAENPLCLVESKVPSLL